MSNSVLKTDIIIPENQQGREISGHILVKSNETIGLDFIEGSVYFESRGRMSGKRIQISTFNILKQKQILKNETYEFPFTFSLDNKYNSYKGKNVSFSYNFKAKISVNNDDYDKLDRSFFSKAVSFITSDKSLKIEKQFQVNSEDSKYQIVEEKLKFKLTYNWVLILLIALSTAGSIIYYLRDKEFHLRYIVGVVIVSFLFSFLLNYLMISYINKLLGEVTLKTLKDDDEYFLCSISKKRRFNLVNQKVFFEIIEKVVDKRGTSSSTYTEILYTSPKQAVLALSAGQNIRFKYPNKKGLETMVFGDAEILWRMNLEGQFYYGLMLKYEVDFVMSIK